MTRTCVICKKEPIPHDDSRSFHKFPKNEVLKQKWLIATGKSSSTVTSCVCSDHFTNESFHQTDGYTTVRRLLSTAVPTMIISVDVANTIAKPTSKDDINSKPGDEIGNLEMLKDSISTVAVSAYKDNIKSKPREKNEDRNMPVDINSTVDVLMTADFIDSQSGESDFNIKVNNRKRHYPFTMKYFTKKKFCYKDGVQTEWIRREDFVSDEAWERFLKFMTYKNNQIAVIRNKYFQKNKKVDNLTTIVKELKKMKYFASAKYSKFNSDLCDKPDLSTCEELRKCAKCGTTPYKQPELSFHRIPVPDVTNIHRVQVWAEFCYPDGDWESIESLNELRNNHTILCSKHFLDVSFVDSERKDLKISAVPLEQEQIISKTTVDDSSGRFQAKYLIPAAVENYANDHDYCTMNTADVEDPIYVKTEELPDLTSEDFPIPFEVKDEDDFETTDQELKEGIEASDTEYLDDALDFELNNFETKEGKNPQEVKIIEVEENVVNNNKIDMGKNVAPKKGLPVPQKITNNIVFTNTVDKSEGSAKNQVKTVLNYGIGQKDSKKPVFVYKVQDGQLQLESHDTMPLEVGLTEKVMGAEQVKVNNESEHVAYWKNEMDRKVLNLRRELEDKCSELKQKNKQLRTSRKIADKLRNALKCLRGLVKKAHSVDTALATVTKDMTPAAKIFTGMQVRLGKCKSKGGRFTDEEKALATFLYRNNRPSYRLLSTIFILPSERTVIQKFCKNKELSELDEATRSTVDKEGSKDENGVQTLPASILTIVNSINKKREKERQMKRIYKHRSVMKKRFLKTGIKEIDEPVKKKVTNEDNVQDECSLEMEVINEPIECLNEEDDVNNSQDVEATEISNPNDVQPVTLNNFQNELENFVSNPSEETIPVNYYYNYDGQSSVVRNVKKVKSRLKRRSTQQKVTKSKKLYVQRIDMS